MAEPVARGPIPCVAPVRIVDGWEVSVRRSDAPLRLMDCTPLAKRLIRGEAALDVPFGRAARRPDGALVAGSGVNEWTVLGGVASTASPGFVSVIDMTHGRALMRLTGADAARALAKVCAIDLRDRTTPDGRTFRTSVAKVVTDVVRDDRDGERSYLLHCEWSSGAHLFHALLEAGAEFGIDVEGFAAE